MKRCPTCNRVETDEALKFCRADGATLVSESSSIDEAGTIKLASGHLVNETPTCVLSQTTDANMNRATAATMVLPAGPTTTNEFRITTKTRLNTRGLAVIGIAIVVAVTAAVVIFDRTRSSSAAIQSIA